MIPRRIVRTVPAITSDEVEGFWQSAIDVHPGWEHVTWRDPIDPAAFPLTAHRWDDCSHPAQRAGLIRLEDIWRRGGVYIDSDVECYRPFTPLLGVELFAGWEDPAVVPDAVFGAVAGHPAVGRMLGLALDRLTDGPPSRRPWNTGPGVFTEILPGQPDALLLPPGSLYPYHYSIKKRARGRDHKSAQPWAFCAHHWHASWVTPK